ncbi:cache domain-containing protein [Duganella violaceipulchra]|uniref:Cache domain-containing protein n=1 Tax=Duganella violaceipulchra TaxID=2849652 RepID=A0AA41HB49_9BURK|nr:cache domain-containing protein [Duganella violaceicalia]MBV6320901.1 cache domain-containing protein [Duganella violaceicalia]MCP2008388.1 signal transduction histidine kinase [Duganella violaceicalia]
MRTQLIASVVLACALLPAARAADIATKAEAEAMVHKALKFMKANGKEKTYGEINRKDGPFTDRDLYLTVYGMDGVVRAHGANAKMIGKNLLEIKDVDGKAFVKERVELAKKKQPFWQDYKFTNPVSGQIEPKSMYCVPEEDLVVCGGVYLK